MRWGKSKRRVVDECKSIENSLITVKVDSAYKKFNQHFDKKKQNSGNMQAAKCCFLIFSDRFPFLCIKFISFIKNFYIHLLQLSSFLTSSLPSSAMKDFLAWSWKARKCRKYEGVVLRRSRIEFSEHIQRISAYW